MFKLGKAAGNFAPEPHSTAQKCLGEMRNCGVCATALGAALNDMGKGGMEGGRDVALPYHQEEPKA